MDTVSVKDKSQNIQVVTKTPMRITLAGGGTDVLWYSKLRGGAWISAAIDKYIYVAVNPPNTLPFKYAFKDFSDPIIKECLKLAKIEDRLRIAIASDLPPKLGLGGSGAYEVGLLHAFYAYKGKKISKIELAKLASCVEIERLKRPVGPQDQYITALGGIKYFEIDINGKVKVENLKLPGETIAKLKNNLLFFATGIKKDTERVLGEEKDKIEHAKADSEKLIKTLDEIKTLGFMVKEYLLKGNTDEFGLSLHKHWLLKKQLSNKVSSSQIDEWYNEGIKMGALGGKIMGAGGGGCFVFYVNRNKTKFREKMRKLGLLEFKVNFDWEGTKLIKNKYD